MWTRYMSALRVLVTNISISVFNETLCANNLHVDECIICYVFFFYRCYFWLLSFVYNWWYFGDKLCHVISFVNYCCPMYLISSSTYHQLYWDPSISFTLIHWRIKTKLTVSGITKSPIMRQFIKYQAIKAIHSNQDVSRFKIK